MAYSHDQPDWPELTWDNDKLASPLAAMRHQQGRLLGKMESLGFELRREASLAVLIVSYGNVNGVRSYTFIASILPLATQSSVETMNLTYALRNTRRLGSMTKSNTLNNKT